MLLHYFLRGSAFLSRCLLVRRYRFGSGSLPLLSQPNRCHNLYLADYTDHAGETTGPVPGASSPFQVPSPVLFSPSTPRATVAGGASSSTGFGGGGDSDGGRGGSMAGGTSNGVAAGGGGGGVGNVAIGGGGVAGRVVTSVTSGHLAARTPSRVEGGAGAGTPPAPNAW